MDKAVILIIEDDPVILKTNQQALEMQGYRVLQASTVKSGKLILEQETPDLIILDILLPDGNGLDYCEELRKKQNTPVLFLSALGTSTDILFGLRAGGEDYISKPYDLDILLAKVEILLRRCNSNTTGGTEYYDHNRLCIGNIRLDLRTRRGYLKNKDIHLSPREFIILEVLIQQNGIPISADELYWQAWDMDTAGDLRTIWVHISTLRSKLGDPEKNGFYLLCSRNKGYYLSLEDE